MFLFSKKLLPNLLLFFGLVLVLPELPRDEPGESGKIVVKFDSSNRPGMQRKAVTLITNTSKGKHILNIKSIVIPKS